MPNGARTLAAVPSFAYAFQPIFADDLARKESMSPRRVISASFALSLWLLGAPALAAVVAVLPVRVEPPDGTILTTFDNETRYGLAELGHTLVTEGQVQGALRQAPKGNADLDTYVTIATATHAEWVVATSVVQQDGSMRVDLRAYWAPSQRMESVARTLSARAPTHEPVREMLQVLLRPEGVGTGRLPWERSSQIPQPPAASPVTSSEADKAHPMVLPATRRAFFAGLGLGYLGAVARPSDAIGRSSALVALGELGYAASDAIDIRATVRTHVAGPRAYAVDLALGYDFLTVPGIDLRLGAEIGPGIFVAQGGARASSFMLRATPRLTWSRGSRLSMQVNAGDLQVIPAAWGTLVLGGFSAHALVRF